MVRRSFKLEQLMFLIYANSTTSDFSCVHIYHLFGVFLNCEVISGWDNCAKCEPGGSSDPILRKNGERGRRRWGSRQATPSLTSSTCQTLMCFLRFATPNKNLITLITLIYESMIALVTLRTVPWGKAAGQASCVHVHQVYIASCWVWNQNLRNGWAPNLKKKYVTLKLKA